MTKEQVTKYINKYADRLQMSGDFLNEVRKYFKVIPITYDIYYVEDLEKEIIIDYSI